MAHDGGEARFRALFDAHYDRVYAYAARRAGATIGEDIAANVLALAWQKLDEIPADREVAWLLTAARHVLSTTARGDTRRRSREAAVGSVVVPDIAGPVAERSAITDALCALSSTDRELLLLCLWDEVSLSDAARVLGLTPGTVRVRLHRARARFRTVYTRQTSDPIGEPA
ncbi:RNA polymerase sigma factor [Cellulomonas fengjieae]|uniref:RNA polymerase sigma factor n=1 Tax=Cellulomonas fengjieae TaxID=2819978 RepID=A0ABS3SHT5_9CELL|nr:RNA polymerase sigma factor [Cellulomonas fengjieae]MBO3084530.1 RNA polymerase sigma factor [Cellulomonas fengjieae]MBO3103302.1 RNA polymerase sigma factor [Cellulomonas fengjieae]QVI67137.1 RNA polymerase sigma factor [Cellulomonas fengjieae]